MWAGFGMDGDAVRARLGEGFQIAVRAIDHQMRIDGAVADLPDGGDHTRAEADIGHEGAVHHVQVQPVGARGLNGTGLLVEPAEIG
jgi:hypothetical protein